MRTRKVTVFIQIHYKAESKGSQQATFPLRGRIPVQIALEWWKQIKKEMFYRAELEKIIADNQDITQLVKELEEDEWRKKNDAMNDLPF
jgi:hypothetical protein